MPANPQDVAGVVAVLNEVNVKKGIFKQFDEGTFTLDIMEKGDQGSPKLVSMLGEVDGKYVRIAAHTDGNPNVGVGVSEKAEYPAAGAQEWKNLKYRSRRLVSAMSQTAEMLSRGVGEPQSMFRIAARETEALIQNTRKRMNYYALGDGSGLLCSAISWDDTNKEIAVDTTAFIKVGQQLMLRGKADGSARGLGSTANSWLKTGSTFRPVEVTGVDVSASNRIKIQDLDNASPLLDFTTELDGMGVYLWDQQGEVPYGLQAACGTVNDSAHGFSPSSLPSDSPGNLETFGAIDRVSNAWWQAAPSRDLSSLPINIKNDIEALEVELIERDSSIRGQDALICLTDGNRWYQVIHGLEASKRTSTRTRIIEGKYEVVRSGVTTFAWDPDMKGVHANKAYIFAPKYFFRMILTSWRFETRGGSQWTQSLGDLSRPTGIWQANLESEQQLVVSSCQANKTFTNIG